MEQTGTMNEQDHVKFRTFAIYFCYKGGGEVLPLRRNPWLLGLVFTLDLE